MVVFRDVTEYVHNSQTVNQIIPSILISPKMWSDIIHPNVFRI